MARIRPEFLDKNIEVLTLECPYCNGTGEMSGSDLHDDMTHCPMCDSYAKTGLWEADCGHAGCGQCITSMETPQGEWSHCDECNAEGDRCNECNENYLWFMVGEEEVINDYHECDECNTQMCGECNEDHDPCPVTGVHRAEGARTLTAKEAQRAAKKEKARILQEIEESYQGVNFDYDHEAYDNYRDELHRAGVCDPDDECKLCGEGHPQGEELDDYDDRLCDNHDCFDDNDKHLCRWAAEDTYWNPESDYDEAAMGMYGIVALTAVVFFGLTIAKGYTAGKK
jgi:hypothetical protein